MKLSNQSKILILLIILFSSILRLVWLNKYPPSLYTDEAGQGYNAYSIMLTGRDEHGAFLPVSLRSFGDWKPPLPTYFTIPFVYFFGLNEWSVRLPSAILGIASIIFIFYIVLELFYDFKSKFKLSLLCTLFLSMSPWHILQSRSSMLVAIAIFFLEGGVYFFLKATRNKKYFLLSAVMFGLSVYSYYGLRVITPLILIMLTFLYRKKILQFRKELFYSFILGFVLMIPLITNYLKEPDVILGRARTVSIFYDQGVKLRQWELITQDGIGYSTLLSRFFHNNVYMYSLSILRHFMSHLDGNYLFFIGDTSSPFQIPNMGILYLIDSVFILLGVLVLMKQKFLSKVIILGWFIVSLIPASLTFMTPSSNRTFNAVIPLVILISFGVLKYMTFRVNRLFLVTIVTILYLFSLGFFLKQYFISLPVEHADWWNYGWREAVKYTTENSEKFDNIIVSDINGMPYIYFLFYEKVDPLFFQKAAVRTYLSDRFGFEHVESFGKYIFIKNLDWSYMKENMLPNTLYVIPSEQTGKLDKGVSSIKNFQGKEIINFFEY